MRFLSAPENIRLVRLSSSVGIYHLGDSPHGHLSGQTKALPDWVVDQFVERQPSEALVMPRLLANPIAGPIGSLQGAAQSVRVGRRDLDCDGQSRNASIEPDQLTVNRLKGGGIRPGI